WSLIDGADYAGQGNFGAPYRNSLHRTTAGEASFTKIYGTISIKTTNGVTDPTWECKVDNTIITLKTPFPYTENNCKWDENTIPAGRHTVTVTAKSSGRAFLFDFFQYIPSPGANVQNAEIYVPFDSPDIKYRSGWKSLGRDAIMAPNGGAVLTFPFYGTGITWVGTIPRELPSGPTSAEYKIDGQSITTFQLVGNSGSNTQYFQRYFQLSGLPLRSHTLEVTSRGETSLTPLVLGNLIVQGGLLQEPTDGSNSGSSGNTGGNGNTGNNGNPGNAGSTSISSSTTVPFGSKSSATSVAWSGSSTPGGATVTDSNGSTIGSTAPSATNGKTIESDTGSVDPTSNSSSSSIGPIIGGVVGGILIILLILAFLLYRRKRSRRAATVKEYTSQTGFGYSEHAQPFYTDSTMTPTTTQPGTSSGAAATGSEGSYGQHQMAQTCSGYPLVSGDGYPHISGSTKRSQVLSASNSDPFSSVDASTYAFANPSSSSSGHSPYSNNRPTRSTVSGPSLSVMGSSEQLLPPPPSTGNSKFQEAFGSLQSQHNGPLATG
ncbi:hypothetical protein CVT25_007933, partial [Psilocybe cyanescens]